MPWALGELTLVIVEALVTGRDDGVDVESRWGAGRASEGGTHGWVWI